MVQVRIEIVHGELDMMIATKTSSYRVEMVEVMITNQDIIYNLTLLINLLNLKTNSY